MKEDMIGIVIDQYNSPTEVIKILRKYTNDSIGDIKNNISNGNAVLTCSYYDDVEISNRILKCIDKLKAKETTVKIIKGEEEIPISLLKNRLKSSKETAFYIDAETELETDEVDMSKVNEYSYLWDGKESGWCVLKDEFEYKIYNKDTHLTLNIEDEDLNNQVASMMIMKGMEGFNSEE
ncbi:MAG: hypothetical protein IKS48_09885 [Eubacterium sp.]|nr:hypothetical protein [Eubacterium sp.]